MENLAGRQPLVASGTSGIGRTGVAEAARELDDGRKNVRITAFVLPWFDPIALENPPFGDRLAIFAAPIA